MINAYPSFLRDGVKPGPWTGLWTGLWTGVWIVVEPYQKIIIKLLAWDLGLVLFSHAVESSVHVTV